MIIAKSGQYPLMDKQIQANLPKHGKIYSIALYYANTVPGIDEYQTLQFVNCENDYVYFLELLQWLNEYKIPALIYINTCCLKVVSGQPFLINKNLCMAYEGIFNITPSAIKEKFKDVLQYIDDPLHPTVKWMLSEKLENKDSIILMSNLGEFTYMNTFSRYVYQGHTYSIYAVPYFEFDPDWNKKNTMLPQKSQGLLPQGLLTNELDPNSVYCI